MKRPCPRCGADEGFHSNDFSDSGICNACGQRSTNAEIARGKPWTQEEIEAMTKGTK